MHIELGQLMPCPFKQPDKRHCHCGKALTGRQTKFCSRKCSSDLARNHRWTQAKATKKAEVAYYLCANASIDTNYFGQVVLDSSPLGCQGFTQKPEVDHIEPCNGKHGVWGCHHHLDNLRVLCPPCHKKVTAQQAADRAAKRRKT